LKLPLVLMCVHDGFKSFYIKKGQFIKEGGLWNYVNCDLKLLKFSVCTQISRSRIFARSAQIEAKDFHRCINIFRGPRTANRNGMG